MFIDCLYLLRFWVFPWICALLFLTDVWTSCKHPLLCLSCPQKSSFSTWPPLPTACCFVVHDHPCKTCPDPGFLLRFPVFSCPPLQIRPNACIRAHFYPLTPIRATFWLASQNMMFGEISPGHSAKTTPCTAIFDSACVAFVPARAPAPHHTHPHLSTPIYIHVSPSTPCIYCTCMCYSYKFKVKNTNLNHLNIKFQIYY